MTFNSKDINKNDLNTMEKDDILSLLSHLEQSGGLFDFIAENHPEYISSQGEVAKFTILQDFKLT